MKGSGGSDGGVMLFLFGLALCIGGVYFFLDSVRVHTGGMGWISGLAHRRGGLGLGQTTSMGLIFVPFFVGVVMLFYNSNNKIGWVVTCIGIAIVVIEILSRIRFHMNMKVSHILMLFVMVAGGLGMILRSFKKSGGS